MNNPDDERICGNCLYNGYDKAERTYICTNHGSEMYGCYNAYTDSCEDFESFKGGRE